MAAVDDLNEVLDSDTAGTDTIEARLDGHHVANTKFSPTSTANERIFMDVESDPVARAVYEEIADTRIIENRSACSIDIARRGTRAYCCQTSCL